MSTSTAARKVQEVEKPTMTVLKTTENKKSESKKLQAKAEDVKSTAVIEEKKPLTIEEIKRKSEVLTRLSLKYDRLIEQRKRMENFAISHDNDTAEIMLHDAKGETFKSNSPKAIAKFIEFCKNEFTEVIKETESQMREIA